MGGIADLVDSDIEDSTNFANANSILPSGSEADTAAPTKSKGGRPKGGKSRAAKPVAAARKAKASPKQTAKSRKPTGAKRKALEEHVNGQAVPASQRVKSLANGESEDELESPKTLGTNVAQGLAVVKAIKKNNARRDVVPADNEADNTPTVVRQSHFQSATKKNAPKVFNRQAATNRTKVTRAAARPTVEEPQPESMDTETEAHDQSELAPLPPKPRSRAGSRIRQEATFRWRAGSASDTERPGEPNLRRKLGDITRKFENIDLKYRTLRDVGIVEANANVDKLRKQCDATMATSNELVASLKKELALQAPSVQESRKLQKTLAAKESEGAELRAVNMELRTTLAAAQNEIKALQARLAASRSASIPLDNSNSKAPSSALRNNNQQVRTVMVGSAEVTQAAQAAQLKEDLYSDLTGLIVRSVKRSEEGDTYDCIQTGRNGGKRHLPSLKLTTH
jgi:hypothetical protein